MLGKPSVGAKFNHLTYRNVYFSGICSGNEDIKSRLERIIEKLCKGYSRLYKQQSKSKTLENAQKDEFFGLRDFYR